ncbi:MAG: hypothetical protein WCI63_03190 [bacterium]
MEIGKQEFFKIFASNFNYEIVDTKVGQAIKMPARDAFIYSSITGAGYLDNPSYPFTPKGLMKLFYNALNYKFVTGIFDNTTLKHTPYLLNKAKPYIFEGDKYILPVEFTSDGDLERVITEVLEVVENPNDYLIQRIELRKKGNGMEPFMEYLASEYFKKEGYIVETQVPLAHSIGSPDFAGYGINEITKEISDSFQLTEGFHLIELSMIRACTNNRIDYSAQAKNDIIVGEAKTSTKVVAKQLEKYLDTGLFDEGYEINPLKDSPEKDYFGLVSIGKDYQLNVKKPDAKYNVVNGMPKQEYINWLVNYYKFYLIANLTNDELNSLYQEKRNGLIRNKDDISTLISELSLAEIIKIVKSL